MSIHNFVDMHMTSRYHLYIAAGFYAKRTFQIMYHELEGSEKTLGARHGYSVVPWGEVVTVDVRHTHMDTSLEHYRPSLWGIWWDEVAEELDPRWSFVALDPHGRLADYCLTERPAERWIANGRTEAYIYLLGVDAEHRGHSLSTTLLGAAMSATAADKVSRIGLDVDTGSPSNARAIHERFGFVDGPAEVFYTIDQQGRECAMTDSDALNSETLPVDTTCPSDTVSPTSMSLPESHHGIVQEVLEPAHLHKLTALISRMGAQDNPPYRTSTDEIAEVLTEDRTWRGLTGFTTRGITKGRMVTFGQVVLRRPDIVECLCQSGVGPSFRKIGLGGSLAAWQEATARQMLTRIPNLGRAQIAMQVEVGQENPEGQLKLWGFHWACIYRELHTNLSHIPNTPDLGSHLGAESRGPGWEEPVHMASNRLSELEWDRPPLTQERWLSGRSAFVSEWSFVAVDRREDRPRPLGFLLVSKYVRDWAVLEWREGYVDQMGALEEARSSRAVNALIIASMRTIAESGMDRIGADLGSANHSGALAIYDYLGFAMVAQMCPHALEV